MTIFLDELIKKQPRAQAVRAALKASEISINQPEDKLNRYTPVEYLLWRLGEVEDRTEKESELRSMLIWFARKALETNDDESFTKLFTDSEGLKENNLLFPLFIIVAHKPELLSKLLFRLKGLGFRYSEEQLTELFKQIVPQLKNKQKLLTEILVILSEYYTLTLPRSNIIQEIISSPNAELTDFLERHSLTREESQEKADPLSAEFTPFESEIINSDAKNHRKAAIYQEIGEQRSKRNPKLAILAYEQAEDFFRKAARENKKYCQSANEVRTKRLLLCKKQKKDFDVFVPYINECFHFATAFGIRDDFAKLARLRLDRMYAGNLRSQHYYGLINVGIGNAWKNLTDPDKFVETALQLIEEYSHGLTVYHDPAVKKRVVANLTTQLMLKPDIDVKRRCIDQLKALSDMEHRREYYRDHAQTLNHTFIDRGFSTFSDSLGQADMKIVNPLLNPDNTFNEDLFQRLESLQRKNEKAAWTALKPELLNLARIAIFESFCGSTRNDLTLYTLGQLYRADGLSGVAKNYFNLSLHPEASTKKEVCERELPQEYFYQPDPAIFETRRRIKRPSQGKPFGKDTHFKPIEEDVPKKPHRSSWQFFRYVCCCRCCSKQGGYEEIPSGDERPSSTEFLSCYQCLIAKI